MVLNRFGVENVRAKEKTIWTPVSLGGFYLALRHVQLRLLEPSHPTAAWGRFGGDSCYSPTYFGHGMSQALDFTAGSCLSCPWSWGGHFPCLGEVAPAGPCRRQSPPAPPERRVGNESRVFVGIPFRECGSGTGRFLWVMNWGPGGSCLPLRRASSSSRDAGGFVCVYVPVLLQEGKVQKPQVRTSNCRSRWTNVFVLHFSSEHDRDYQNSWVIFCR